MDHKWIKIAPVPIGHRQNKPAPVPMDHKWIKVAPVPIGHKQNKPAPIKSEFEQTRLENLENKQLLLVAQQKDESSSAMITELTQLVKEQKGRIAELVKCKNEQAATHKERTQALEESLKESRKQVTQMELLKQAKSRLQATVQAQESVIDGLKAERKLWGQELAQQGASLSQDRGRLEAKIETLQAEIATLKKQLEEILDRAAARKEELKQQVVSLQAELKEAKDGHSILSSRWKEKSALIGRLEEQVTQMKTTWTKKELQLQAERDAALTQAKYVQRIIICAETFRAYIYVALVEDEMRDMLRENEASKRAMEAKVKKLTQALGDLQTDLL
ncbi:leucine-rich repeat and coiled-coil domain-containing protein 1-like [Plakobranchus ocellatus]|uniref:Leucine-rich repeat and coiled-coil domain-containing protein 1-like n=1 Tax=Plakobranchus ocellatus TaxID=259542 RepID=A0AAV4C2U0_9GAST|nr:leucine-rich repeat and coiled-coil domain-containing protein 1-like [Plakobranchus ocellatus]